MSLRHLVTPNTAMPHHVTPFTIDQVGYKAVRFSSKGIFSTHKDHMVDPYAATRIPKEHQVQGFYYWPQNTEKCPSLVLLHDKWGLTPDSRDMAIRLACEGYVVMVPNLYGRQGGMVTTSAEVADALAERMNNETVIQDINASCEFLNSNITEDPDMELTIRNAHAVIGLGLGGTLAILFALKRKRLRAAVSFYGILPDPIDVIGNMHCQLLYHAAEAHDTVTAAGLEHMGHIAREAGKTVDVRQYPGTSNGFCDLVRTDVYNESAAGQAWRETITFLNEQLPVSVNNTAD